MYQAEVQSPEFNSCQQARNTSNASIIVIHMVNIKVCVRAPERFWTGDLKTQWLFRFRIYSILYITNLLLGSIYVKTCQMNHIVIVISASLTLFSNKGRTGVGYFF